MLVLRRKVGESIILDGVISVSVLAVEGERVKIGITAPPDVTIVREELLKSASAPNPDLPPSPTQSVQSESAPRL
ncbi:MAG TPA: carbon storage regulator [Ktedonobacteraceae bacterium]|jgi:carbon storage regulator|nr:carbon storage regulator [Ktedonobacteraceae bacterium]